MILSNTTQVKPWKDPQSDNNVDHIKIMKMAAVEGGHTVLDTSVHQPIRMQQNKIVKTNRSCEFLIG
jgi:hypothetical protein